MSIIARKLRALLMIAAAVSAVWSGAWAQGRAVGYEIIAENLSSEKNKAGYGETFSFSADISNAGSDEFPGGQISAALLNGREEIVEIVGAGIPFGTFGPGEKNRVNISCAVTDRAIEPQRWFRLTVVVKPDSGKWETVFASNGGIPALGFSVAARSSAPAAPPPVAEAPAAPPVVTAPAVKESGGGNGMTLVNFTSDKTTASPYEQFNVTSSLTKISTSDTVEAEYIGAALVDGGGNIAAVIGTAEFLTRAGATRTMKCAVPETVKPGRYRLRTVVKLAGKEWRVASMSTAEVPTAIDFTVKPPEPGTLGGGYGLAVTKFKSDKTTVSPNEPFTVVSWFRNSVPPDTVNAEQVGVALADDGGNIAAVVATAKFRVLPPTYGDEERKMKCAVPETVKPGRYTLRPIVKLADKEWRFAAKYYGNVPNVIDFTVER